MSGKPSYEDLEARVQALEKAVIKERQEKKALMASLSNSEHLLDLGSGERDSAADGRKRPFSSSEKIFQKAFHNAPLLMSISTIDDGRYLDVNNAFVAVTGYTREQALGKTSVELGFITPADRKKLAERIRSQGRIQDLELALTKADGTRLVCLYSAEIIEVEGKKRLLSIAGNITRRKQAEKALDDSEQKWRNILVNTPQVGISLDPQARIVFANEHFLHLTGWQEHEVLGQDWFSMFIPENVRDEVRTVFIAVMNQKATLGFSTYENEILTRSGEIRNMAWSNVLTMNAAGDISDVTCLGIDLTERKLAEKQLEDRLRYEKALAACSQDLLHGGEEAVTQALQRLIEVTNVGRVYIFENFKDATGNLCARQTFEVVADGVTPQIDNPDLQGLPYADNGFERWVEILAEGRHVDGPVSSFPQAERHLLEAQGIASILILPIRVKGEWRGFIGFDDTASERAWRPAEIRLLKVVAELIGSYMDRKQAEQALRQSEDNYKTLAESPNSIVMRFDRSGRILFVNAYASELFGYSVQEMLGRKSTDLIHPPVHADGQPAEAFFADLLQHPQKYRTNENENMTRDGQRLWISWTNTPTYDAHGQISGLIATGFDITAKKSMETQLQQAQKHEALGTLTGGIAHDFNNILAIILGYTEIAEMHIPQSSPGMQALAEVKKASVRARDIVSQLLAFTRTTDKDQKVFDIRPILKEGLKMLRSTIPANIEFQTVFPDRTFSVKANATQIHQILVNLCTNAAHAMEEGGVIRLELQEATLSAAENPFDRSLAPGEYVKLVVSDTGHGIPRNDLERIFDPYFTTKDVGKGSGLGLSVVLGMVHSYGGSIRVQSEIGEGTTFEILFPASQQKLAEEPAGPQALDLPQGSERILFVDDEAMLTDVNKQRLMRLGYQVTGSTDPLQALTMITNNPDRFDLVITDMAMPKMTGDALTREILKIRANLPVILCTGHSDRVSEATAADLGLADYLQKPQDLQTLAISIRNVLDRQ